MTVWKLKDVKDKSPLSLETLQTIVKKKTAIEELGTYKNGSLRLTLFGYTTGKTGTENNHDFRPDPSLMQRFSRVNLTAKLSEIFDSLV